MVNGVRGLILNIMEKPSIWQVNSSILALILQVAEDLLKTKQTQGYALSNFQSKIIQFAYRFPTKLF